MRSSLIIGVVSAEDLLKRCKFASPGRQTCSAVRCFAELVATEGAEEELRGGIPDKDIPPLIPNICRVLTLRFYNLMERRAIIAALPPLPSG